MGLSNGRVCRSSMPDLHYAPPLPPIFSRCMRIQEKLGFWPPPAGVSLCRVTGIQHLSRVRADPCRTLLDRNGPSIWDRVVPQAVVLQCSRTDSAARAMGIDRYAVRSLKIGSYIPVYTRCLFVWYTISFVRYTGIPHQVPTGLYISTFTAV